MGSASPSPRQASSACWGPTAPGKTTAIRILATLLRPDAGHAWVGGYDVVRQPQQVRRLLGLTGQYAAVDQLLSGRENLSMLGRLLGLRSRAARRRADQLLAAFDLAPAARKPVKTYSDGMRRRLDLAASLVGQPRILILDEPTTGLDPRSRIQLWDLVRGLVAKQETTVVLTTQYLEEADQLADRIVVIDHGHTIAAGTPDELKAKLGGQVAEIRPTRATDAAVTANILEAVAHTQATIDPDTGLVTATAADPALLLAAGRRLDQAGIPLAHLALRQPSLDEVFLTLTGQPEVVAPQGHATHTPGSSR
jgi:ABC-type multidrug transport system ATPase subunit